MCLVEWEAFNVGMMSTNLAVTDCACCISFCSVDAAVCPSGVWNIFVETHPVVMNGLFGCPQLEVAPESIIVVCWLVAYDDGIYTLVIVAAASTRAVNRVLWVSLVHTLCLSIVVLVSHCWLDSALDPIPRHSVFLFFWLWFLLIFPRFCFTTAAFFFEVVAVVILMCG